DLPAIVPGERAQRTIGVWIGRIVKLNARANGRAHVEHQGHAEGLAAAGLNLHRASGTAVRWLESEGRRLTADIAEPGEVQAAEGRDFRGISVVVIVPQAGAAGRRPDLAPQLDIIQA